MSKSTKQQKTSVIRQWTSQKIMRWASSILLTATATIALIRSYAVGDLWLRGLFKEISRSIFDWWESYQYNVDDSWLWDKIKRVFFFFMRSHVQQNTPGFFEKYGAQLYYSAATVLSLLIPFMLYIWFKILKPRFWCKTDPKTDLCLDDEEENVNVNESDADKEKDVICDEKEKVLAEGVVITEIVCLSLEDTKKILDLARKREEEQKKQTECLAKKSCECVDDKPPIRKKMVI